MIYKTKIEIEVCCENCNEAIHWHLEQCPICDKNHTGVSDTDSDPYVVVTHAPHLFRCSECKTEFRMLELKSIPDEELNQSVNPEYDHEIEFEAT